MPKAQLPLGLAQVGEVGEPVYPELQVADVQLPAAALVALPEQLVPAGDLQAAACGGVSK